MLARFVTANRDAIIARTRLYVAARRGPRARDSELLHGVPVFLDQLVAALRLATSTDRVDHDQIHMSATRHGHDLSVAGLTIGNVVHVYGDVCQAITEMALEQGVQIPSDAFRTLNLCLDDAIAGAVTEFADAREQAFLAHKNEGLGVVAHELRNLLNTAILAFQSIESGRVAVGGSTGMVLGRSLRRLRTLVDRSLADVRLDAGINTSDPIMVTEFLEEVEIAALLEATARGVGFTLDPVPSGAIIRGDRQILTAALSNLLLNAFKFTPQGGHVSLSTHATANRVLFAVEDECGGLPAGKTESLFRAFRQHHRDRSGLGLGLAISAKAAAASHGEIHVRNLAGKGCIFTLDLPLSSL